MPILKDDNKMISQYKELMTQCMQLYMPYISYGELQPILDYSIDKRLKDSPCKIVNTYTKKTSNSTLLSIANYINDREPVLTAHGVMFKKHGTVPNPLSVVVKQFLNDRSEHKKTMFTFPKGSEDFEKYNLLQQLDKINVNSLYGVSGMPLSLIYNVNMATSVTTQGRALISSATMLFESFLADNVKFGSINEVVEFINHICKEKREYNDREFLDHNISPEDCFAKIIMECGYRWIPCDDELEIIWRIINNLRQEDINRVYYKNNLYEFLSNKEMKRRLIEIMATLKNPFFNPLDVPDEIKDIIRDYAYIIKEYVYYRYMYIDRIDRCDNMIKSVIAESDTDSCIISLDAWYRFALNIVINEDLTIKKYDPISVVHIFEKDEFGDLIKLSDINPIKFEAPDESYDFINDEIIEHRHIDNPLIMYPQDYLRYSIISVMGYILDLLVNDYMEKFCDNNNANEPNNPNKMYMKTEFLFLTLFMTDVKKAYASMVGVQEGHLIPKDKQLDIKGIASMAKSSMSQSTRDTLKNILLKDVMLAKPINQFKLVEDLAIFEKKIINSIKSGSKEYYKPVTIKAASAYDNPMRIQGIKASTVWNSIKPDGVPGIDLETRNAVDIAKINLNIKNAENIKDKYPEVYEKAMKLMTTDQFKGSIDSIAIPMDYNTPEWIMPIIDYNTIVNDNISGFPYESVGLVNLSKDSNYSNILQL